MQSAKISFALTVMMALGLAACTSEQPESPKEAVERTVKAIKSGAQARSLSAVMEHISDNYQDHLGQTKSDLRRLVQFQFLRNQNIFIYADIEELTINDDVATVEVNAAMAARASDLEAKNFLLRADTTRFSVVMRQVEGQHKWQVESVAWQSGRR